MDSREDGSPVGPQSLRCEACDKSFTVWSQLQSHLSTHVICGIEGCTFSSSERVLKEHRQQKHGIGGRAAVSVAPLTAEEKEDIRKWREERRRHYPTESNMKRKAHELQASAVRGELLPPSYEESRAKRRKRLAEVMEKQRAMGVLVGGGDEALLAEMGLHGRGRGRGRGRGVGRGRGRGNYQSEVREPVAAPTERNATMVPPSAPTLDGEAAKGGMSGKSIEPGKQEGETGALEGLAMYTSDSDERDGRAGEGERVELIEKGSDGCEAPKPQPRPPVSSRPCRYFMRGRCTAGASCRFSHERKPRQDGPGHSSAGARNKNTPRVAKPRQSTLLEKLLEPQIVLERSHLLQCLRFAIKNSFFQSYGRQELDFSGYEASVDTDRLEREASGPHESILKASSGACNGEGDVSNDEMSDEDSSVEESSDEDDSSDSDGEGE
eukprot:scaffold1832_cov362-Prasinococcus_capsulatus_cf.AAC.15